MESTLKKYIGRHFKFNKVFGMEEEEEALGIPPKRRQKKQFIIFVRILRVLPMLCLGIFVTSFFFDFTESDNLLILGFELKLEHFLRMVSVSGLIGFSTNWVAIKMLFKPVLKRPVWGQGLIPAQKDRIVWQLAGGIHTHILNEELIRERIERSGLIKRVNMVLIDGIEDLIHDEEFRRELKAIVYVYLKENLSKPEVRERFTQVIDTKLDENLKTGFKGLVFQVYKKLNKDEYEALLNNVLNKVPGTVVEIINEIQDESGQIALALREREHDMEKFFSRLIIDILERLNIRELLTRQMEHLDESRLEEMIWNATNEQLLYIQYLGTLLGILGGLLIWQPLVMGATFVSIFLILFFIDLLLYKKPVKTIVSETTETPAEESEEN